MRLTMSGEKKLESDYDAKMQTVIMPPSISMTDTAERKFLTKKRIITAIVAVSVTALIVIGIIVGIWIFTEESKMVLQYKLSLVNNDNSKANQDVSTNKEENLVQYHVKKDDSEWWIIEDFNRNLKVAKVQNSQGVFKCLVTGLDEATSAKPAHDIQKPSSQDQKAEDAVTTSEMMTIAADPVKDSSFLGTSASKLCANTPVYWTYTTCYNATTSPDRTKRYLACTPCGCGYKVCLTCGSVYYYYWRDIYGIWHCSWNVYYCYGVGYYVYYC